MRKLGRSFGSSFQRPGATWTVSDCRISDGSRLEPIKDSGRYYDERV